jgi:hypothetical protein
MTADGVVLVRSTGHGGPAAARHPDGRPLDAGLQVAALAVVQVEGVQVGQQRYAESLAQRGRVREGLATIRAPAEKRNVWKAQLDMPDPGRETRRPARSYTKSRGGEPAAASRRWKRRKAEEEKPKAKSRSRRS